MTSSEAPANRNSDHVVAVPDLDAWEALNDAACAYGGLYERDVYLLEMLVETLREMLPKGRIPPGIRNLARIHLRFLRDGDRRPRFMREDEVADHVDRIRIQAQHISFTALAAGHRDVAQAAHRYAEVALNMLEV